MAPRLALSILRVAAVAIAIILRVQFAAAMVIEVMVTVTTSFAGSNPHAGSMCDGTKGLFTCRVGSCYFDPTGAFACCNDVNDCFAYTTCIPNRDHANCKEGDRGCVKCYNPASLYCNTLTNVAMGQYAVYCGSYGGEWPTSYSYDWTTTGFPMGMITNLPSPTMISEIAAITSDGTLEPPDALRSFSLLPTHGPTEPLSTGMPGTSIGGVVIAGVIGGATAALALLFFISWFRKRSKKKNTSGNAPPPPDNPEHGSLPAYTGGPGGDSEAGPGTGDTHELVNVGAHHPHDNNRESPSMTHIYACRTSPAPSELPTPPAKDSPPMSPMSRNTTFTNKDLPATPSSSRSSIEQRGSPIDPVPIVLPPHSSVVATSLQREPSTDTVDTVSATGYLGVPNAEEETKRKSSQLLPVAGPYLTADRMIGDGYWEAEREQLEADKAVGVNKVGQAM